MTPNTSFSGREPAQQLSEKAKGKRPMMLFTANPANRESLRTPPPRDSPDPREVWGVPAAWPLDKAFRVDPRSGEFQPKPPTPNVESRPPRASRWREDGVVPDSQEEDSDYALTQTQDTVPGTPVTPVRPLPIYAETVRTEKIVTKTVYGSRTRRHGHTVCIQPIGTSVRF